MKRLFVSGSLAYDRLMHFSGRFADHILPEKVANLSVSFSVSSVEERFGGTGGNIAYTLGLFGLSPHLIATAGEDAAALEKHLAKHGVDVNGVQHVPGKTSSCTIISDTEGNNITAFHYGAGAHAHQKLPDFSDASFVHIAATSPEDMRALPEAAREKRAPFAFDPSQQIPALEAKVLEEGMRGAQILFGNAYELDLIMHKTARSLEDLLALLAEGGAIVITDGERGSRIVSQHGLESVKAVLAHPENTTGAGDAYRAGFLLGLLKDQPYTIAAQLGATAAAFVVERAGTQEHSFTKKEFRERFESTFGEFPPVL
jgi:adenosine kinase